MELEAELNLLKEESAHLKEEEVRNLGFFGTYHRRLELGAISPHCHNLSWTNWVLRLV